MAAASATATTLAEGVARLIEKQIASQHARRVDDIAISPKPPGSGRGAAPVGSRVIEAGALRGEAKEAIDRLLRQETNRTAFRTMYRQRVATFQHSLESLEADVARELEAMPRPEVVVGVRGREDTQIVIARAAPAAAAEGAGGEQAGDAAAAAGNAASARGPSRTTNKAVLREGLVWASGRALAELGLDPEQPFAAGLAMQILGHPQMRWCWWRSPTASSARGRPRPPCGTSLPRARPRPTSRARPAPSRAAAGPARRRRWSRSRSSGRAARE